MVITLLSTEQREQMRNDFLCDVVDCLHKNTEAYHYLSYNDFAMTVEKYFITSVESSDRLWEDGKIRCIFEYNGKQVEHNFVGKLLVNAQNRNKIIKDAFDNMYSKLINTVLVNAEASEYYDELDY